MVAGACVLLTAGIVTLTVSNLEQPMQGIPQEWSVLSGDRDQWDWAGGKIIAHSITGETVLASSKEYRDVTVSAVVSTTNREASLAIHFQDADNGYIIIFTPDGLTNWPAHIDIVKKVSNRESTIASYHGRVFSSLGCSAKVTVAAKGPWLEARLNGVPVLRTKDTTFTSGFIGLRIFGDPDSPCDATFSNLTIK